MYIKSIFSCPVCGKELKFDERSYKCESGHCFDRSKSGYVNLLTSDKMHSKLPGDNKLMVRARRSFLQKGYYSYLAESLSSIICRHAENGISLIDAGCGEGYYTEEIFRSLRENNIKARLGGLDISKSAVDLAAKRKQENIEYAVSSVFHIPAADKSIDISLSVFSPICLKEFYRILRKNGLFYMVIPDTMHLWELKSVIYDRPYENQVKDYLLKGFDLIKAYDLPQRKICLESNEDIMNLFSMTPYYYNTSKADKEKLKDLNFLETVTQFKILVYMKKGEC